MGDGADRGIARLRELDAALARREPAPAAVERVGRALATRALQRPLRARLRWWPILGFAGGAALMAALIAGPQGAPRESSGSTAIDAAIAASGREGAPAEPASVTNGANTQTTAEPANLLTARPAAAGSGESSDSSGPSPTASDSPARSCRGRDQERLLLAAGECIDADGVRVDALAESTIRWTDAHLDVVAGELLFEVLPRGDHPLEIRAGRTAIEVVGTRFVVHVQGRSGSISMLEGHVRARVGGGPARDLRGGERLRWPAATTTPATSASDAGDAATTAATTTDHEGADPGLTALLGEVAELRRRGAYTTALARLRAGDQAGWSRRAHELISYEIGAILERQLGDIDGACAHWTAHQRRFPAGIHAAILERTIARLGCP